MTDATASGPAASPPRRKQSLLAETDRMRKRNAAERRFEIYGMIAVGIGVLALVGLLTSILLNGLSSFWQTFVEVPITLEAERLDPDGNRDPSQMSGVSTFGYKPLMEEALVAYVDGLGVRPDGMEDDEIADMISGEAPAQLRNYVLANPDRVGETIDRQFLANGRIDGYFKDRVSMASAELDANVTPNQLVLAERLEEAGTLATTFNWNFFRWPDASDTRPEAAGLGVAILGSLYMMLVVLALALPIGVAASIYLEEFAPKNRITDLIEVNISNLAAVPSIVFGILGLAIFINWAGLPQSAPIVGGLVLTLMTLPTIIIATRSSLMSKPTTRKYLASSSASGRPT